MDPCLQSLCFVIPIKFLHIHDPVSACLVYLPQHWKLGITNSYYRDQGKARPCDWKPSLLPGFRFSEALYPFVFAGSTNVDQGISCGFACWVSQSLVS